MGTIVTQSSATYDAAGNRLSTTDARGNTTTFTYDATGAMTQEVAPVTASSAITTSFGYDTAGNRTRYTDGRGNALIYTYNPWNKQESLIEPTTATYTATADRTFTTSYDADGRPVSQTQPGGVSVTATYDSRGNLTGQTGTGADATTAARSFGYDAVGRLISAGTSAIGTSGTTGYVPASNETFTYNDRGELLTTAGTGGSSTFGYNSDGLMTSRADATGTTSYTYDSQRLRRVRPDDQPQRPGVCLRRARAGPHRHPLRWRKRDHLRLQRRRQHRRLRRVQHLHLRPG
ncbi:hypothetical protein FNH05_21235 [Amycolatopsis rhizosphaerae]|uniref:RHS repeat protein n=1 Tax=Amycolatopsis rhizosphaerae TaxID=2053003 RepID=A0A558C739_9PSEU|nr:RHS repeat domain-containing protein [Amycolatopsis rhizosphaerae]TVT44605.1 hypothetical protein FNH05_21235 [Amycolatopsis rhizosphaerae]